MLIDAGPLVAYLVREEEHHEWVRDQFALQRPPLLTCEPVLTEAAYLVGQAQGRSTALLELLERGVLQVAFSLGDEVQPVRRLMERYQNVPMALADACLVRMAELRDDATVFTLDSDFGIYRKHGRQVIPVLGPPVR
jgi:predicted nucleic acid-binding protein